MDQPDLSIDTVDVSPGPDWKTDMSSNFRDGMANKIEQAMVEYGSSLPSTAREMESRVFSRAGSKAEYMDFMGRMIIHLNIVGSNHESPIFPQPTCVEEIREVLLTQKQIGIEQFHNAESAKALMAAGHMGHKMRPLMKGMDDYPKALHSARIAPYEVPGLSDPGNEFQPFEPEIPMFKAKNALLPCPSMEFAPGIDAGFSKRSSAMAADEDVKKYICKLILEDRSRQLKRVKEEDLNKDELKAKEQSIEEFADLCMAKGREVPSYLCDKWSHKIFNDPVITPSGYTYERNRIEHHLRTKGNFDPVTRVALTADLLIPNLSMKQVVCAYMAENAFVGTKMAIGTRKTIVAEQSYVASKRIRLSD